LATISGESQKPSRLVDELFLGAWKGTSDNAWKHIEGLEQRRTPFSDHLLALFTEWGRSFVGLVPDFELMFERFEVLGSLAHLEKRQKDEVLTEMSASPPHGFCWMPIGRAFWDSRNGERLISEIQSEPFKVALVKSGFARGNAAFIDLFCQNFNRMARGLRW
jgi:hypothetical protein